MEICLSNSNIIYHKNCISIQKYKEFFIDSKIKKQKTEKFGNQYNQSRGTKTIFPNLDGRISSINIFSDEVEEAFSGFLLDFPLQFEEKIKKHPHFQWTLALQQILGRDPEKPEILS